jgi:ATP-dependent Clp protease ATP-binding subunit ClpB
MTSNLGAHLLNAAALESEATFAEARKRVNELLKQHFRPEFLNRIDDIVIFRPLGEEQLKEIVDLRLEDLRRMLADRHITLVVTDPAKELLLASGYDREYGARPMKRAIQHLIQDPLALRILDGEIVNGDSVVVDADPESDEMKFEVENRAAAAHA